MPTVQISTTESDAPARMANVFVAEEPQMLRALSANTSQRNVEVSFSVYLLDDGDLPEGGELVATCKRTFEDAGYHRVELDEPVLFDGGQRYSVVVEQKAPDGTWRVTANTAANKEGAEYISQWNGGSPYYVNGVVNRGESYLYDEAAGGWSDWRDVLDALAADPGQALLASAEQSVDGSDVDKDAFWVPETEYLLLEGAVAGARDALALEDPTLGEIDLARESLEMAMEMFATAKKPGLKEQGEQKPPAGTETEDGGAGEDDGSDDAADDVAAPLAGTGDGSGGALVGLAAIAAGGASAAAVARRKRRMPQR